MTFLRLFLEFFKIGICAFGGGLATIPFLEELSQTTGWFSLEDLANMIAISESTPGAIGVNMATYVGYTTIMNEYNNVFLAFLGGATATLSFVMPSIIVILIICQFLNRFRSNKYVEFAFYGLRAASFGLICSAAYSILKLSIVSPTNASDAFVSREGTGFWNQLWQGFINFWDYKCLILAVVMGFFIFKFKKHPIIYIAAAAIIGIIFSF